MKKFDGFPTGSKLSKTAFPALFFSDLLPMIDDLAELKVTLFCFWALNQKEGNFRCLRRRDFDDKTLQAGLCACKPDTAFEQILSEALARALERGTLLSAEVKFNGKAETLYFVNSERGRAAYEQVKAGAWHMLDDDIEILPERPNIYRLYEDNIGLITPRIADHLKDAEVDYPLAWIEEAIYLAVESNKRSWRYIQAILKRWETEGKSRELAGRPAGQNGQHYVSGPFADFIEH